MASVERQPTAQTLWMLNRLINGERDGKRKERMLGLLTAAAASPTAGPDAVEAARRFEAFHFQHRTFPRSFQSPTAVLR